MNRPPKTHTDDYYAYNRPRGPVNFAPPLAYSMGRQITGAPQARAAAVTMDAGAFIDGENIRVTLYHAGREYAVVFLPGSSEEPRVVRMPGNLHMEACDLRDRLRGEAMMLLRNLVH